MVTTVRHPCGHARHRRGDRPQARSVRNAAQRGQGHRRPARARTAAAARGALGGLATSAGGMTGPNLATRVGAAIARRKPASAQPDAPSQDAPPPETASANAPAQDTAPPPDTTPAEDSAPAGNGAGPSQDAIPAQDAAPAAASAPAYGAAPARDAGPDQDAEPAQPPATPPAAGPQRSRPSPTWALAVLRRHWLFAALLTAGLVLRVLTMAAYHPALIYVDT